MDQELQHAERANDITHAWRPITVKNQKSKNERNPRR